MHLEFEEWVLSQDMSETAEDLFQEAITCYKASAYRAALLFSYLGFQTIIKDRILVSRRPTGINEALWEIITNRLTDDSTWDSQVFDATQMKSPAPIFILSDDLRRQVTYWKDRRNDCAHSRGNEIGFPHAEAFWLFLRSNLPKFVVSGSKEGLLNEIRVHFDRSLTPADADYSHIVQRVPYAIETGALEEFFEGIDQVFADLHRRPPGASLYPADEVRFFDSILDIGDRTVTSRLVDFLRGQEDLLVEVLRSNPVRVLLIADDHTFIRRLWYEELLPMTQSNFEIYCSLLRNRLIPEDQVEEAHRRTVPLLSNLDPSEECYTLLEDSGFFDVFRDVVFLQSGSSSEAPLADRFGWANSNFNLVVWYLNHFGIDEQIACSLSQIFGKENHPYDLRDAINAFLSQNEQKREELLQVFEDNQIPTPDCLRLQGEEEISVPF
jgi:hypothetical protein